MLSLAVMMVKNEIDVISGTVEHLVDEVDHVFVADNGSTDGTRDVLSALERDHAGVHVFDDPNPAFFQSVKMTALAGKAVEITGEESPWILPIDADELWYWEGDRICVELNNVTARIVEAKLYNHFPSGLDGVKGNPFEKIVYRQQDAAPLPKVAFRWEPGAVIHQGNHGVTLPSGQTTIQRHGLNIRHFPYRSLQQFIDKAINGAKAYAATDLPLYEGAHWREYGALYERGGRKALQEVFEQWFYFPAPVTAGMILDPAPYQRWVS